MTDVISVDLNVYASDLVAEMTYRDVPVAELAAGKYAYVSGELSAKPCGMKDSEQGVVIAQ